MALALILLLNLLPHGGLFARRKTTNEGSFETLEVCSYLTNTQRLPISNNEQLFDSFFYSCEPMF